MSKLENTHFDYFRSHVLFFSPQNLLDSVFEACEHSIVVFALAQKYKIVCYFLF